MLYRRDPKPLHEDLPKIFSLLAKKIDPMVSRTFPLLEAQGPRTPGGGSVEGKIVLENR